MRIRSASGIEYQSGYVKGAEDSDCFILGGNLRCRVTLNLMFARLQLLTGLSVANG